jgi:hypothetical protein
MKPQTKNLLKTLVAFVGTSVVFTLICAFGGYYWLSVREDNAGAVAPVAVETDNTVKEHIELDDMYRATCNRTLETLKTCNKALEECSDILQHHAVLLPREEEKK